MNKAKEYGQKSFEEAKVAEDPVWELNAGVLIAQAEGNFMFLIGEREQIF